LEEVSSSEIEGDVLRKGKLLEETFEKKGLRGSTAKLYGSKFQAGSQNLWVTRYMIEAQPLPL
jgi:hypothetical protein